MTVNTDVEAVAAPALPRLKTKYNDEIKPELFKQFEHENINQSRAW